MEFDLSWERNLTMEGVECVSRMQHLKSLFINQALGLNSPDVFPEVLVHLAGKAPCLVNYNFFTVCRSDHGFIALYEEHYRNKKLTVQQIRLIFNSVNFLV